MTKNTHINADDFILPILTIIIAVVACVYLVGFVYNGFYIFNKNETNIYVKYCSLSYYCKSSNSSQEKLAFKVFPEQQVVILWNQEKPKKYNDCIIKDKNNFVCIEDGHELIKVFLGKGITLPESMTSSNYFYYWIYKFTGLNLN